MTTNTSINKELIAGVFNRAASGYGHIPYFRPFGRRLVELAQIPTGASVLDVASGRGAVLFPAAERVGLHGRVIGIDLSQGMARETSAEICQLGLKNAEIYHMDAENLDFPDASFDYVLCGFALFFFPHLERAVSEMRRVLKPKGRIAVSTWGSSDPCWSWYGELLAAYQAVVKLHVHTLAKHDNLRAAFDQAGFAELQIITEQADWVCADEEEWWAMMWSKSDRAGLEKLEPSVRERFKAEAFERMQALRRPDGFHYRLQAHLALATKPSTS